MSFLKQGQFFLEGNVRWIDPSQWPHNCLLIYPIHTYPSRTGERLGRAKLTKLMSWDKDSLSEAKRGKKPNKWGKGSNLPPSTSRVIPSQSLRDGHFWKPACLSLYAPTTPVLLLIMTLLFMGYPFHHSGSANLAVSPHNLLPASSLLATAAMPWKLLLVLV